MYTANHHVALDLSALKTFGPMYFYEGYVYSSNE